MKRTPKSPIISPRRSPNLSPKSPKKSPRKSPRKSPKSPRYSKVDRALKDAGIPMNMRDTIYNFGTDSIYQYLLDNVIVDFKDKSTWKFDEKRFVVFVKKNYFKSKNLRLDGMNDNFKSFGFEDEKNRYHIEIRNYGFKRMFYIASYKNAYYYRDYDKPPVEIYEKNGKLYQVSWYKENKYHRDNDKPAIVYADGRREWYQNEKLHREGDKPAIIWPDGKMEWYQNGKRYRENGKPQVEYPNGKKEWYMVFGENFDELIRTEEP